MANNIKTLKECFDMLRSAHRISGADSFYIDAIGFALFADYDDGAGGVQQRGRMREFRPTIDIDLKEVFTFDQFEALIAQYKMDLSE